MRFAPNRTPKSIRALPAKAVSQNKKKKLGGTTKNIFVLSVDVVSVSRLCVSTAVTSRPAQPRDAEAVRQGKAPSAVLSVRDSLRPPGSRAPGVTAGKACYSSGGVILASSLIPERPRRSRSEI